MACRRHHTPWSLSSVYRPPKWHDPWKASKIIHIIRIINFFTNLLTIADEIEEIHWSIPGFQDLFPALLPSTAKVRQCNLCMTLFHCHIFLQKFVLSITKGASGGAKQGGSDWILVLPQNGTVWNKVSTQDVAVVVGPFIFLDQEIGPDVGQLVLIKASPSFEFETIHFALDSLGHKEVWHRLKLLWRPWIHLYLANGVFDGIEALIATKSLVDQVVRFSVTGDLYKKVNEETHLPTEPFSKPGQPQTLGTQTRSKDRSWFGDCHQSLVEAEDWPRPETGPWGPRPKFANKWSISWLLFDWSNWARTRLYLFQTARAIHHGLRVVFRKRSRFRRGLG